MASDKKNYIVGIGASAGGLEAIQGLVSNLPEKIPGVSIIIAQHLSPDYKSVMAELLSRRTDIKISYVKDGMKVTPGKIYISPPSDDLVVSNGLFKLKKATGIGAHPSIDRLFSSIAGEAGLKSAGVILSGTGKDGTAGIEDIKSVNGTLIVQDPATARYDGMPVSAISTEMIDTVLPAEEIGTRLIDLVKAKDKVSASSIQIEKTITSSDEAIARIIKLMEQRKGIDFSDYKVSTLHRRIQKRVNEKKFDSESQYLNFIIKNPEELDELFQVILIGVTTFYRDPEGFKKIEQLLSDMINEKKNLTKLRIWVSGCATGEEAYTYAIILNELLKKHDKLLDYQIFATDIDLKALHSARIGIYKEQAVNRVPPILLNKYFNKRADGSYQIDESLRKQVLFSKHDVTVNPPFLKLDLISCRNLLIYFNNRLQQRVLPLFYYALKPGGYLILGKSENIGSFHNIFSTYSQHFKIFNRRSDGEKMIKLPYLNPKHHLPRTARENLPAMKNLTISEMVKETMYSTFKDPYVVIDDGLEIVEISGDISKFVKLKTGSASLNLIKLIHPELQMDLRYLVNKVGPIKKPAYSELKRITIKGKLMPVKIAVMPLVYSQPGSIYYMVIFEELILDSSLISITGGTNDKTDNSNTRMFELEQELSTAKEHMHSLVEELETSNEELQSVNEEMQASNEELQASNEELETSNEELQATNEELENAYSELRQANLEISNQKKLLAKNSKNLDTIINNTLVGFILIDYNYKILTINKTAQKIFKIISGEKLVEGDSYAKIISGEGFSSFQSNFKKALNSGQFAVEETCNTKRGKEKIYKVDYSSVDSSNGKKESGYVVLSIIDITDRKQAENDLKEANENLYQEKQFMNTLTENLPSHIWTVDNNGNYTYCNKQYLKYVGKSSRQLKKFNWIDFVHPDDREMTNRMWQSCLEGKECMTLEHRLRHKSGDYRWYLTYAEPIYTKAKSVKFWVGFSTEIESLKRKNELEQSVSQLTRQRTELMKLNKIKDDFVSLASHQLRTPASAVKQYIKLILDEYAGPYTPEQGKYLLTAYSSNERQLNIINDLLKTAQLDTTGYNLNKSKHSIVELCRQTVEELKPIFDLKQQKLKFTSDKDDIEIPFDNSEIKLVLENLIINANKYSFEGTEVKVKATHTKKFVKIAVTDNGVGILPEKSDQVFEKFIRLDNELSDTVTGTGLGLYIAKKIVEAHDGTINVKPNNKKGSTFTVKLPR